MVRSNVPTSWHHGAPKHGAALLSGLLRCRRCGRKLTIRYTGAKHNIPRYSCWRGVLDNGEPSCIAFGGLRVDDAIEQVLLRVVEPEAIALAVEAKARANTRRDQVRAALVRDLEAARYSADRAFRQYDVADPGEPAGPGGTGITLETGAGPCQRMMARRRSHPLCRQPTLSSVAADFETVWSAPTTDARLKKRIVRTLIHEVIADIDAEASEIVLTIHWVGGFHTELRLPRRRRGQRTAPRPISSRPCGNWSSSPVTI